MDAGGTQKDVHSRVSVSASRNLKGLIVDV